MLVLRASIVALLIQIWLVCVALEPSGAVLSQSQRWNSKWRFDGGEWLATRFPPRQTLQDRLMNWGEIKCAESELEGLNALYWNTGGQHWLNNSGWNTSQQCCSWHGVVCESGAGHTGAVTRLALTHNNLTGDIGLDFAASTALQASLTILKLGNNRIRSLPENIGLLANLLVLDVSSNSGSLNLPQSIGNTSLVYLHIGNGTMHPPFEGTRLVTVPDSLTALENLTVLDLSYNSLSGPLDPGVFNLPNLEVIDFSLGRLEIAFPENGFTSLKKLRHFDLDYNDVYDLPDNLNEAANLLFFSVSATPGVFHGQLPESIGQLTKLKYLSVTGNYNMQGPIPVSVWNISSLEYMDISYNYNNAKGTWPETFQNHQNLQYLEMGAMFYGHLPDILGELSNLTHFGIRTNLLSGPIPESLGNLSKLVYFNVAGNYLNGTIPGSLRSFIPNLKPYQCAMDSNDFSCPIPSFVLSSCGAKCT